MSSFWFAGDASSLVALMSEHFASIILPLLSHKAVKGIIIAIS